MAKYIIRLDDACPTFNFEKWKLFFNVFDKYGVKPIIAVIPNNKNKTFSNINLGLNFWKEVRKWDNKGYNIAMHGFEHVYVTKEKGIIGLNNKKSEFAGLALIEQKEKLRQAQEIFNNEKINPKVFVAPAHTFDFNTLKALKSCTNVEIISDGFALNGFCEYDFKWIPMQLWGPKQKKTGLWTICYHPETSTQQDLVELESFIKINIDNIISVEDVEYFKLSLLDYLYRYFFYLKIFIIKVLSKIK